jgi:hypothetical protein
MGRRHHWRRDNGIATAGLTCMLSEMGKISRRGHSYKDESVTIHTIVCRHITITSLCNIPAFTSAVNCFKGTSQQNGFIIIFGKEKCPRLH